MPLYALLKKRFKGAEITASLSDTYTQQLNCCKRTATCLDSGPPLTLLGDCKGGGGTWPLWFGGGKAKDGRNRVWGEGATTVELQKERDGGDSLLATTDSSIRRQRHTTFFCALKHTRSGYKLAIYLDSGLSLDASSEVHGGAGGGAWPLRLDVAS